MKTTTSIEINATPAQVWPWIYDEDKIEQWVDNFVRAETVEKVEGEVGTTFVNYFNEGGKEFPMHGVVRSYNEYTDYEIHLTGKMFDLTISYDVEDLDGKTRATQHSKVKLNGIFKLMYPIMLMMSRKGCKDQIRMMENMKNLVEADAASSESL